MKPTRWLALAAALLPAAAAAAPVNAINVYQELLRFRAKPGHEHSAPLGDVAMGTERLLKNLLDKPHSLYSKPLADPPIATEPWWPAFTQRVAGNAADPSAATLDALRYQLGVTRARPGHDVTLTDGSIVAYRSREVAANALKAGIDADIFWKAFDMNGSKITVAAAEAVAVQMLRDLMYATPKADWTANAIKPDVLDRYMAQTTPDRLSESDVGYLANIASYALRKGGPTLGYAHGTHQLPIAFRIARLAAAYKDSKAYFSTHYCENDRPRKDLPIDISALDDNTPLCFIAATDRGVLEWFNRESALEARGIPIHENRHEGWSRLAMWIGQILMFADLAAFAEVVEATVAGEVIETAIADGTFDEADGDAGRLLCAGGEA